MNLKDLEPIHRSALRTAWLDLCHANEMLAPWEPDATAALRGLIVVLLEKYPNLAFTLRPPADCNSNAPMSKEP